MLLDRKSLVAIPLAIFLIVGLAGGLWLIAGESDRDAGEAGPSPVAPSGAGDPGAASPFGAGRKVTLEEAEEQTPYALPIPPVNSLTGELAAIWKNGVQVAFVWANDMRFYTNVAQTSEEEAAARWKASYTPARGRFFIVDVGGHVAVAAEGTENQPSGLVWQDGRVSIQLISPVHSLEELQAIASEVRTGG
ncbi:MAG: hypothetical protein M3273_01660 [Actinomycetota bacterium]|nr:hypothetical protein [Actinomycetota bacterium]